MEKATETWITVPKRPVSSTNRQACLVHIYPTGAGMGSRYMLGDSAIVLGRDHDCDLKINDQSVSRHHARIQPGIDGYYVMYLQCTNGTFVNDKPASMYKLKDGDYLRVGNWIFRYLTGGNVEAEYHEEIYRLTIIDALTGIHNKRYLLEFLDRELARSARHHRPLSLVMLDIDRFKAVNDELGHLAGDFTLRHLVESHPFQYEDRRYNITVSLGLVSTEGDESLTPNDLIKQADEKLYQAKHDGRNRVV